jgi:hypothetical protein
VAILFPSSWSPRHSAVLHVAVCITHLSMSYRPADMDLRTGFPNSICGGNNGLLGSIYSNAILLSGQQLPNSTLPAISASNGYLGCFTESSSGQSLLGGYTYSSNSMTNKGCITTCNSKGYKVCTSHLRAVVRTISNA